MPRAKRASDERYNERRRARRAAERAERAGRLEEAARLREQVRTSYVRKQAPAAPKPTVQKATSFNVTKTSRPKRPSDELYNARRRLRRQAEKLEREAATKSETEKALAEGYAQFLRQQAATTGKLTEEQRTKALERLGRIRETTRDIVYDAFTVRRRNAIVAQQLNAAGTEGADSSISERKKDVFWAATKGLWPKGSNVPRNERYDLILSHFYTDATTDAREFREWLKNEKGIDPQQAFGDLQYVFEYVTEELNDPAIYELPEVPYQAAMDIVRTAM